MKKILAILTILFSGCFITTSYAVAQTTNKASVVQKNDKSKTTVKQTTKVKKAYNNRTKKINERKKNKKKSKNVSKGLASYYWQPQPVACGGRFNPNAMTAAHKTLPCGTRVMVTNQLNNKSVAVVINDRGPYIKGRIIDLSKAAAHVISMTDRGVVPVTVAKLG